MRYAGRVLLLAGLMTGAQGASAETFTVAQLLQDCDVRAGPTRSVKAKPGGAKKATLTKLARHLVCIAYIRGTIDAHVVIFSRFGREPKVYCAPGHIKITTAAKLLRVWASKDDARQKLPAAVGLDAALRGTYGCRAKP